MDAADKKLKQDRQHFRMAVCVVVLFCFLVRTEVTVAQAARMTPDRNDYVIAHSLKEVPQEFPAARWSIENPGYQRGCVVSWSLDAFALDSSPTVLADADISVTLIKSGNSSRWTAAIPFASTRIVNGKNTAVVSVESSRRGDAVAELRVRFLQPQISTLAAGRYHTTLTGTITGH